MFATFDATKTWQAAGAPDNDVKTIGGDYPSPFDYYFDTTNLVRYLVLDPTPMAQVWQVFPEPQIQSNWTQSNSALVDYIKNKPTIPAAQVNTDWNSVSGLSQLLNKPSFATVSTTGSYNDLSNKPSIPSAQIQSDWTQASTGALDYIKNKPSIPSAQVNADWNASSGVAQILNKPAAPSFSTPNFSSVTTATQLSSSRSAFVIYTFPTSMTTLIASQTLTATLQYADDSGFTTNVVTFNSDTQGCSGIINLTLSGRLQVSGMIPAGKYRKVTLAQTGGATVPTTISSSQEVLL